MFKEYMSRGLFPRFMNESERVTYLEAFLGGQNFTEDLACFDTQGVAEEPHLFDVVGAEVLDVGFNVGGRVELESLAFEGEELIIGDSHYMNAFKRVFCHSKQWVFKR